MLRRTLARLDVTSRTLYALVEPGSCFAGTLLELALAADRSLHARAARRSGARAAPYALGGELRRATRWSNGRARLAARFYDEDAPIAAARAAIGAPLDAAEPRSTLGLVTAAPDDSTGTTRCRIALEERASLSPDALTGMEANLRFGRGETMETRIFGRLSAWQNWIFIRPNAIGEPGALKVFGTGNKARFDCGRV